jgi:hypothetical protein
MFGGSKVEFTVPKLSICSHSEFFETACNGRWETKRANTVQLDEMDPVIFGIFVTWMYTGFLKSAIPVIDGISDNALLDTATREHWDVLAKCFVAADFLQALNFQNAICDALLQNSKMQSTQLSLGAGTSVHDMGYIWENTRPESVLRSIVLNQVIHISSLSGTWWNELSHEFLQDLSKRSISWVRRGIKSQNVWMDDPCIYHTHLGDTREYSCQTREKLDFKTSDKLI